MSTVEAELQRKVEDLEAELRDYRNSITWDTTCQSCATMLDHLFAYEETDEPIERAKTWALRETRDALRHSRRQVLRLRAALEGAINAD